MFKICDIQMKGLVCQNHFSRRSVFYYGAKYMQDECYFQVIEGLCKFSSDMGMVFCLMSKKATLVVLLILPRFDSLFHILSNDLNCTTFSKCFLLVPLPSILQSAASKNIFSENDRCLA